MCPLFPSTFLQSVHDVLGSNARPTPILFFSLKHNLFVAQPLDSCRRFLLASETRLGKSLAYLLPTLRGPQNDRTSVPSTRLPEMNMYLSGILGTECPI